MFEPQFLKKKTTIFLQVFWGLVDHAFKTEFFEADHMFKPSLA